MNEKALRRDLHAQAARRGLLRGGDKSLYLDFLRENFGVESSTRLTFRQLQEAVGLLRGSAPALRRRRPDIPPHDTPPPQGGKAGQPGARGLPPQGGDLGGGVKVNTPAPFPRNPPAPRRYVMKGKVVSLGQERHLRAPASPAMEKKLFAYGFNCLGWDSAAIRAEVLRMTGKDIRDLGREPDVLTVDGVNRVLGSMRAIYRHHKARPADSHADAEAPR